MLKFKRNPSGRRSAHIGTQECGKCITTSQVFYILRPSELEKGVWFASLIVQHHHGFSPMFEATTWVKRAESFRAAREAAIWDFEKRFVK